MMETLADRNVTNYILAKKAASAEITGKIIIYYGTGQEVFCLPKAQDGVLGEGVLQKRAESYLGTE